MTFKIKKVMKKALGLMMALAMVLPICLGTSVSHAAEEPIGNGSITIKKTVKGEKYDLYKILDATVKDGNVSYTMTEEWNEFFQTGEPGENYLTDTDTGNLVPLKIISKQGNEEVKYLDLTSRVEAFAKDAQNRIKDKTPTRTVTADGENLTIENLPLGYYLLYPQGTNAKPGKSTIVSLKTVGVDVDVEVKADYPVIEKKVKDAETGDPAKSAQIGDVLSYEITGKVPDTTDFSEYFYQITDKLSEGLTLHANTVKVSIDGVDETNIGKYVTVETKNEETGELVITFKMKELNNDLGESIVGANISVTYDATLNENAKIGENGNSAILDYSRDPHNPTDHKPNEPVIVKVYTARINIYKKDDGEGEAAKPLSGAKFVLMNIIVMMKHLTRFFG